MTVGQSQGGETAFGDYRIDGRLGAGGMGVVFDATDLRLGRRVALKVMSTDIADSKEFWLRFEREAQVLARLDSPHVTKIYEYGEHEGAHYIATQLVAGGDLRQLINKRGPLPPQLAARVCAQVAAALRDAHAAGIVHRDVKPGNVLVRDPDSEPHAYLCDFGIAATGSHGLTATGAIAGTWTYLAPERIEGEPATPATDIYALGCLLWAALTGRPPYTGPDVDVALQHLNAPVPQLVGDSPIVRGVNQVLTRSLAKQPGQRYPDAESMRADLIRVGELPADGFAVKAASEPGGRRTRRLFVAAGAALAVVAATAVGWVLLSGDRDGHADPPTSTPSASTGEPGHEPEKKTGVTADYDGDGYGDLSVRVDRGGSYTASTWASDGTTFAPGKAGSALPGYEVRGDFDGDGRTDRAAQTWDGFGDTLTVELNYGGGGNDYLRRSIKSPAEESRPVAGDFDGDGKSDLGVVLRRIDGGTAEVWVLAGAERGLSSPREWLSVPEERLADDSAVPGDFDGDGRDDLAVIQRSFDSGQARVSLAASNGTGFRLTAAVRIADDSYEKPATAGDFDGDDKDELVLVSGTVEGRAAHELTERGGRLAVERRLELAPGAPELTAYGDLVAGDFDGDGLDDLVSLTEERSAVVARAYLAVAEPRPEGKVWATIPCGGSCQFVRVTSTH